MSNQNNQPQTGIKFHAVPNVLRRKIGSGGIEKERLARAEAVLDDNQTDFYPILRSFITRLGEELAAFGQTAAAPGSLSALRAIVMDVKANGTPFGYQLTTALAGVVLDLLERVPALDKDGLRILQEFQRALEVIASHKLSGDGGQVGKVLGAEFFAVCNRYSRRSQTA